MDREKLARIKKEMESVEKVLASAPAIDPNLKIPKPEFKSRMV